MTTTNNQAMTIINLTQHNATSEQVAVGVIEVNKRMEQLLADVPNYGTSPTEEGEKMKERLLSLLNFSNIPTKEELEDRAEAIALIASDCEVESAMIGGASYLMPHLEKALKERGIKPLYSFTQRESVERTLPNGEVQKTSIFKHIGWVEA